jgi:Spy/CpxP family protein refolding chaperone
MNPIQIVVRVLFVMGAALAPAAAQQPDHPKTDAPRHVRDAARAEGVARRLKLTETQRAAIKEIRARHGEALKAHRLTLREARRTYREAARDPKATIDQLRPLHEAMARRQFELMADRRAQREEIRALLTPEQREEAAHLRGAAQERLRERREEARRGAAVR